VAALAADDAVHAIGIGAAYFARGRMVDYPRPLAVLYASSAAQILFTIRSLRWTVP
jgi:hypothetical protein